MPTFPTSGLLRRLPLLALLLSVAPAALAQIPAGAVVQPLPKSDDPAELLAQALRTLATEPGNLSALTIAGHNALALGDPNAAVGFFGRAQEIAPRDGTVKAGLGSALVQLEKPQDALRLFAEASRLGVPDVDIAQDRGLAYDLTGQQSLAQRDYQTVLAAHPEDEAARRRLALSQGISGNKAGAIATLDPLIRKRDIAGWRAQTFVLAMDGDAKGANDITRIMLPQQAAMLQPFLVRLATLSPADKARAVHFGEMPATGAGYTPTQVASVDTPATYATSPAPRPSSDLAPIRRKPVAPVPAPAPMPAQQGSMIPAQVASAMPSPRASAPQGTADTQGAPLADIALTPATSSPAGTNLPASSQTMSAASAAQSAMQVAQVPQTVPAAPMPALPTPAAQGHYDLPHDVASSSRTRSTRPVPVPVPVPAPAPAPVKTVGTPVVHGRTATSADDDVAETKAAPEPRTKPSVSSRTKLATADDADAKLDAKPVKRAAAKSSTDDEDSGTAKGKKALAEADDCAPAPKSHSRSRVKSKATKASLHCTKLAASDDSDDSSAKTKKGRKTADDDGKSGKDAKSSKSAKSADKPAVERIYVQVAGGANKVDMDKAWANVKKKAPVLMKDHKPSTTPLRATNRLLVGPFKTEDEAQAFVNKMAAKGLSGFTFKSSKGQKVEKIDSAP